MIILSIISIVNYVQMADAELQMIYVDPIGSVNARAGRQELFFYTRILALDNLCLIEQLGLPFIKTASSWNRFTADLCFRHLTLLMECSDSSDVYVGIWNPRVQMSAYLLIFKTGGCDELALPP